jgi:DNA-binding IclR family transcriptional regulator
MTKEQFAEEAADALNADPEISAVYEANASGESLILVAKETPEQRDARLKREDYARRNAEAIKEREDIFRRNGLLKQDETLDVDMEAALRQRCCF